MKEKIINLLATESFWDKALNGLGFLATTGTYYLHPLIAGPVGAAFIALNSPIGKAIAKEVEKRTANFAETPSPLDDIVHAAASKIASE